MSPVEPPPVHIVIVGGGFAGVAVARELERSAPRSVAMTLINPENYQLFTPMLPEVAGGSLDLRAIVHPLRVGLTRTRFVLGTVNGVDCDAKTLDVAHPVLGTTETFAFDHIVFALGAESSTFGLPGVADATYPMKTLPDAARIRARVGSAFEAASSSHDRITRDRFLRFVIVGGGFTGVETAGEVDGLLRRLHTVYPQLHDIEPEVVLVEGEHRLLAHLPPPFGKHAAESLRARNVTLLLGEHVASADAEGLVLTSGTRIESATIVWTAGVKAAPLLKTVGLQTNEHGALVVGADLSVPGRPGFWGLGDCAAIPKPGGGTYAPLAQTAMREGPVLARNILATVAGKKTKPFRYRVRGMAASLGNRDAVLELPGKRLITGFPAWVLWRAFYLDQLPGFSRKVRVAADWTLTGLFARGVARLPFTSARLTSEEDHAAEG
jgi:NADH dehydrogenase